MDPRALRALLQIRINARAARADSHVQVSAAVVQRWISEEIGALASELKHARELRRPVN